MRTKLLFLALLATLPVLTGCTQYWYCPSRSFEQCKADQMECLECLNCRTDYKNGVTFESKYIETCMLQKGYRLYDEDELPLSVKRKTPDDVYAGIMHGVAGCIR